MERKEGNDDQNHGNYGMLGRGMYNSY